MTTAQAPSYSRLSIFLGLSVLTILAVLFYLSNSTEKATFSSATTKEENRIFTIKSELQSKALSQLKTRYPISSLDIYRVSITAEAAYEMNVANYQDELNISKQAIVFLAGASDQNGKVIKEEEKASHFRYEKWQLASEAINKHTDENALFISFWDNAQRIHLFSGREPWFDLPDKNAYALKEEQSMWLAIAGGFDESGRAAKYSQLLVTEASMALASLREELAEQRDAYLLINSDDLSHIQEIALLNGQGLPLETSVFPADSDLHNNISRIKDWATEGEGTGSYLVQPISAEFIRAWRITDKAFEDTLLARLLPFTSSLDRPLEALKLVYQSDWGAYLSIYELIK